MPRPNAALLDELFERREIDLARGSLLDETPSPAPGPAAWARYEGMMWGLAIGDALGGPTEGLPPASRAAEYGELRDYLPSVHAGGRAVGIPSDDSQLAFWTLDELAISGRFRPDRVARRFAAGTLYGVGRTVRGSLRAQRSGGMPWYRCGAKSAGNGALMRIAPILAPHLREPSTRLWVDAALLAILTHDDSASTSACLAYVALLWELLSLDAPPPAAWWHERFVARAAPLEQDALYEARGLSGERYRGTLSGFLDAELPQALDEALPLREAQEAWGSGAYLFESLPCVLHACALHAADPEEAILRAVNDTRDNDTIAALVGAAMGALHGLDALPARWREGHSGRTEADDEGRMAEILAAARERFAPA